MASETTTRHSDNASREIPANIIKAELMEKISADDRELVVNRASIRRYSPQSFIFHQGEPARALFLLESGRVRLRETTEQGHELLLRLVAPGEVFGDKGVFSEATYSASAFTDAQSRVYVWSQDDFAELSGRVPRLQTNLLAIISRLLTHSRERYRLLATEPVETRVRWALNQLALTGYRREATIEITGQSPQKDIADLAGTKIFTVNRILNGFQRQGLLTISRGRILVNESLSMP